MLKFNKRMEPTNDHQTSIVYTSCVEMLPKITEIHTCSSVYVILELLLSIGRTRCFSIVSSIEAIYIEIYALSMSKCEHKIIVVLLYWLSVAVEFRIC